jgi:pSer/pThr/pTyr-binding forkhead associated (FHA) protein
MDKIHLKIGSSPDNDMVIESDGVDAYHLELFCDTEGNVFITDLNTQNGTFVNGEELNGYTLLNLGDKVVLGRHYVFRCESFIRTGDSFSKKDFIHAETKENSDIKKTKKTESTSEVSNKQLFLIYGAILIIILLMIFAI